MAFPSNDDMQQTAKPDGLDLNPATAMQTQSASSNIASLSQRSSFPPPLSVSPEPAYIAASAASQIVSASWDSGDVMVSPQALALLNAFLDWVLLNIISNARSTKLSALRPSVSEFLKPKLAKEAVAGADDELKEYLAAGEEEEEEEDSSDSEDGGERTGESAPGLIWKLARLRCMVYTRLGDLEEDQEEAYIVQERLDERGAASDPDSSGHPIVSAAAAIFLTSVLEYLAELALYHAGQATQRRTYHLNLRSTLPGLPERIVVEETDMLQVGRDIPLQRLWRTWRHQVRAPKDSMGKSLSRESSFYGSEPSRISLSRQNGLASPQDMIGHHPSGSGPLLYRSRDGPQLPRPIPENEIDDGKVVGRIHKYDETGITEARGESAEMSNKHKRRSRSVNNVSAASPPTPVSPASDTTFPRGTPLRPTLGRKRSTSLPTPTRTPLPDARRSDNRTTVDRPEEADQAALRSPTPFHSRVTEGVDPLHGSFPLNGEGTEDSSSAIALARALSAIADTIGTSSLARSHLPHADEHALQEVAKPPPYLSTKHQIVQGDQSSLPSIEQQSPGAYPDDPVTEGPQRVTQTAEAVAHPPATNLKVDPKDLALSDTEEASTSSPRSPNREAFVLGPVSSGRPSRPSDISHSTAQDLRAPSEQSKVGLHIKAKQHDDLNLGPSSMALRNHNTVATDSLNSTMVTGIGPWPFVDGSSSRDRNIDTSTRTESNSARHIETPSSGSNLQDNTRNQDRQQQMAALASSGTELKQIPVSTAESVEHPVQSSSPGRRPDTATSQISSGRLSATLRSSPYGRPEMTDKRPSRDSDDKKKSLEHLIQGNETLHYTLTPGPAREATTTYPPGTSKTQTQGLADFLKNTAPPGDETERSKTDRPATDGNAVKDPKSHASGSQSKRVSTVAAASLPTRKELTSPSKSSSNATRLTAGGPRDPKAITPTTRDLADYAKSTGPENDRQLAHALTSRPGTAGTIKEPLSQKPLPPGPISKPSNHTPKGSMSTTADKSLKTRMSSRPKEPRDATGRSQSVHELADFLREGPPREPGDHRISRKVAPFRTTMDSDDLNGLVSSPEFAQQEPVGRPSAASTQESSAAKSVPSSLNSRTALLDGSSRAPRRHINGMTQDPSSRIATLPQTVEVETRPKRKQRRIRDPYAVDMDDDEDIEGGVPIAQPKSPDESLIDFLRNTSPAVHSSVKVQPFILTGQHASTAPGLQKTPSKHPVRISSATGLLRSASRVASNFPTKSDEKNVRFRSANVRADSPHLTQKGSRIDSYKPTQVTSAPHLDRAPRSSQSESADKPQKSGEPNGALNETTEVRDFAPKDEGGFIRFFSRRKKSTV